MTTSTTLPQTNSTIRVEGPLYQLIRQGAMQLIASAVEAELEEFVEQHAALRTADGSRAVVRNGYLPKRRLHTSVGTIDIQVPRVRDRSGLGVHFTSVLLPPYLKRIQDHEQQLPWLYLNGLVSNDFQQTLIALLGRGIELISPALLSRLHAQWTLQQDQWHQRNLHNTRYFYWRADSYAANNGVEEFSILVIAGITEDGRQELVAINTAVAADEDFWRKTLRDLQQRGLATGPKLADAHQTEGFWPAMATIFPDTLNTASAPSNQPEPVISAVPAILSQPSPAIFHAALRKGMK